MTFATEAERRKYLRDNLRILISDAEDVLHLLYSEAPVRDLIEPLQEVGNHIFKLGERAES